MRYRKIYFSQSDRHDERHIGQFVLQRTLERDEMRLELYIEVIRSLELTEFQHGLLNSYLRSFTETPREVFNGGDWRWVTLENTFGRRVRLGPVGRV